MDRTRQSAQPQQRDMMFCHECENEWYRDEHGITCPDCASDFCEIIEAQHDPRQEMMQDMDDMDEDDFELPPIHHPFHGNADDAPDPDEGDINDVHWRSEGPNRMSFTGTFSRTFSPTGQTPAGNNPFAPPPAFGQTGAGGAPIMLDFATMLNGILGGNARAAPNAQDGQRGQQQHEQLHEQLHQQQHQQQQHWGHGGEPHDEGGTQPLFGQGGAEGQGGPGVRIFQGGGPGFSYTATTRVIQNNAQAPNQFPDALQAMLGQFFAGQPLFAGPRRNPMDTMAASLFPHMQHGDAVYSQEALDRIVSQLMEQNQTGNAPGPASEDAIAALPQRPIKEDDLGDEGKVECTICMDDAQVGDMVTVLPCGHWFHGECIKLWLHEHDTCPQCRQGIMPKDGPPDARAPRQPGQAPMHDQMWGQGSREAPIDLTGNTTQDGRNSEPTGGPSSAPSSAGSLFNRMRDAFGGGGGAGGGGASSGPQR